MHNFRLGVVSFLNARPLIEGLIDEPRVQLRFDVPARLQALLDGSEVDAALVPVVDVLRSPGRYQVVSNVCIGCDGETMTVRIFSQTPPDRITTIRTDTDSHTSVLLARVLWKELYGRWLEVLPIDFDRQRVNPRESVLLIGDKVVDPRRGSYAFEIDLGGVWKEHTRLPFVFAVWAVRSDSGVDLAELANLLQAARDRGVSAAVQIAERDGPGLGWPVELARRYLAHRLKFTLDASALEGLRLFGRLCEREGLAPAQTLDAFIAAPGVASTMG